MAEIRLEDLFQAELWSSDDFIAAPEMQNVLNSGILVQDTKLQALVNASEAGTRFELPYIQEPDYSEPEGMDDSDDELTTKKLSWASMWTTVGMYSNSYAFAHMAQLLTRDSDPAKVIRDVIGNYWGRDLQNRIIATIIGLAAKAGSELTLDVADDSTDKPDIVLDSSVIVDGISKVGDMQDKFQEMFIHSKVYGDLKKANLIDTVQPSQEGAKPIEVYGNYKVVVNDLLPVTDGTNKKKYTTVIAQRGMFAYADKNLGSEMPPLEVYRNPLSGKGAGDSKIISRKGFVLHPIGFSYTKTTMNPTLTDLKASANWSMKLKAKQQKFVAIVTN